MRGKGGVRRNDKEATPDVVTSNREHGCQGRITRRERTDTVQVGGRHNAGINGKTRCRLALGTGPKAEEERVKGSAHVHVMGLATAKRKDNTDLGTG